VTVVTGQERKNPTIIGGLRGDINRGVGREEIVLYSLLPRLVILTNSIAQNTDFIVFE
jgi:hypothetical protein